MQVEFSPRRSDVHANYVFDGEKVTVSFGGVQEVYDFTDMPDGEIGLVYDESSWGALSIPLVIRARRADGALTVVLVLTHDHVDRAPEETKFPNNPYTVAGAETLLAARNAALEEPGA